MSNVARDFCHILVLPRGLSLRRSYGCLNVLTLSHMLLLTGHATHRLHFIPTYLQLDGTQDVSEHPHREVATGNNIGPPTP